MISFQERKRNNLEKQLLQGKGIFPLLLLLCLFLLSSCQGLGLGGNQIQPTVPAPTPSPTTPANTQVSENLTTLTPTDVPQQTLTPTFQLATPEFSVTQNPDESPKPWRPPVYPVPWIPSPQDHFYFMSPISALSVDSAYSTYPYGGVFFDDVVHTGIDIPGDIGTPILAAGGGTVIYAGRGVWRGIDEVFDDPYGKAVIIEHDFSYQGERLFTLYAHLDEILVVKGQVVGVGDQIGLLGNTGKTTGPHLHFEVRFGENDFFSTRNPDLWISPPVGSGVLVGQILTYAGFPLERQRVSLYPAEDNPAIGPINDAAWIGASYQNLTVNSDPYYHENFTLANLPAGKYYIYISVVDIGRTFTEAIEIKPGQVTYFRFNLWAGFSYPPLPTPTYIFSPSP